MAEINFIKHSMNLIGDEMNADHEPGSLRYGWQANLAFCIHDAFNSTPYNLGTDEDPEWIGEPLDPTSTRDCFVVADRFLNMLFPEKDV